MIFKQRWIKKLGWGHGSKCCLQSRPLGLPAMLVVATDAIWHSSPTELIQGTTKYSFCVCEKPHAFSRKLLIIVVLTPCCTHWIKSSDDVWKRRNSLPQILQIFCTSSVMLCNRGVEEAVKSVCVCMLGRYGGREIERSDVALGSSRATRRNFGSCQARIGPKQAALPQLNFFYPGGLLNDMSPIPIGIYKKTDDASK